jgi:hypothetical protein
MAHAGPVGVRTREEQPDELLQTLEHTNDACDWISVSASKDDALSQYGIHNLVYYEARQ